MDIKKIRQKEIELFDLWHPHGFDIDGIDLEFSPIEKIFYMNFLRERADDFPKESQQFHIWSFENHVYISKKHGETLCDSKSIEYSINHSGGFYIIDFIIRFQDYNYGDDVGIAVELDGHDFHEKTKEQAQNDKEKDRFLQSHGYLVARFTGSEVYRDPQKCSNEVRHLAFRHLRNKAI